MANRLQWIDYSKGLLIALMVFGHTLSSALNAGVSIPLMFQQLSWSTFANTVPLFFFLSGLTVERSCAKRGPKSFLRERLSQLAYPYLIWSFLQISAEIVFSRHSHHGASVADLLVIPYRPHAHLWFLMAMFWMFPMYVLIRQVGRGVRAWLAAVAVLLFVLPIPTSAFALHDFSVHFLFFATGVLTSQYFIGAQRIRELSLPMTLFLTFAFGACSGYVFTQLIEPTRLAAGPHYYLYLSLATLGGAVCLGWAQFLARRQWLGTLRIIGEYSLQVYVAHMLFAVAARVLLHNVFHVTHPVVVVMSGIAIGIAGPIILYKLTVRFAWPNLFEWRSSSSTHVATSPHLNRP